MATSEPTQQPKKDKFTSQDMIAFGSYLMRDDVIRSKKSEDRRTITLTDLENWKASK